MIPLLILIFLTFISLGLPDAVLGAAWPAMRADFGLPYGYAGVIAAITCAATVASSLLSARLVAWLGVGRLVFVSTLLTAAALVLYAYTSSLYWLLVVTIPLGFGGGAIDAAVNNYVSTHYRAGHLNLLHAFWGVGAMTGPLIIAHQLSPEPFWTIPFLAARGWQQGYLILGGVQFAIAVLLLLHLKSWRRPASSSDPARQETAVLSNRQALRQKGVMTQMIACFSYCALEIGTGLWLSSFLVVGYGLPASVAAFWVAMFYFGITGGRFLCGVISDRIQGTVLGRGGLALVGCGVGLTLMSRDVIFVQIGVVLIGLGCAPIFPAILHQTPKRFGAAASQTVMGLSMASAYLSVTITPLLIGLIATQHSIVILPQLLLVFGLSILFHTEKLNKMAGVAA